MRIYALLQHGSYGAFNEKFSNIYLKLFDCSENLTNVEHVPIFHNGERTLVHRDDIRKFSTDSIRRSLRRLSTVTNIKNISKMDPELYFQGLRKISSAVVPSLKTYSLTKTDETKKVQKTPKRDTIMFYYTITFSGF